MKSKALKSVILIALVCLSMGAFAQSNSTKVEPEYDYVNITFTNMQELAYVQGNILVKWFHTPNLNNPTGWLNTRNFPYQGEGRFTYSDYPNWNPRDYSVIKIFVTLTGGYWAIKNWDGVSLNFVFTRADFCNGAYTE